MHRIVRNRKSVTRLLAPVALAVALAACTTTAPVDQAVSYDITAPATQSSTYYLARAETTAGSEKIDWYLLAFKALLNEGQLDQADVLSFRLSSMAMSPSQSAEWQLNRASLLEQQGKPQAALAGLNFQTGWRLPNSQLIRYHLLRAELNETLENPLQAVIERSQADSLIQDPVARHNNIDKTWLSLAKLNGAQLHSLQSSSDPVARGWAELMGLRVQYGTQADKLQQAIDDWLTANPGHPANFYLPEELKAIQALEITVPTRVAVLLPLSERFANQGQAIRNGFMQALFDDKTHEAKPEVKVIDTSGKSMAEIAQTLRDNQIDFVVGPLQKENVSQLQNLLGNSIPMLALNIPGKLDETMSQTCYLTLSPEQEATQAADHIYSQGKLYPLVMVPSNSFGRRVATAFAEEWKGLTNRDADVQYLGKRRNMQQDVHRIFGLTDSQARIQQMNRLLGTELESEQRSRRDIDAVYMASTATDLSLLKPFIDVTINPDAIPPKLYTGSRGNDKAQGMGEVGELRGIEFSDVPLLIDLQEGASAEYRTLWPNQSNGLGRLYALGMDAYQLLYELPQLRSLPGFSVAGQSGDLTAGEQCVIDRKLHWATFTDNGMERVSKESEGTAL
ncbi:penicillin-binding protein activator [Parasalinivibrio latis]|uniref:penicillin-binding protein activator n=1 Tax=Parasalinivibrio latis TaxID=2952610 RepID=UPI003DA54688